LELSSPGASGWSDSKARETGWRVISDEDGPRDTKDDKINVPNYDLALLLVSTKVLSSWIQRR